MSLLLHFVLPGWRVISCLVVRNVDLGCRWEELNTMQLCCSWYWELSGLCRRDWGQGLVGFTWYLVTFVHLKLGNLKLLPLYQKVNVHPVMILALIL